VSARRLLGAIAILSACGSSAQTLEEAVRTTLKTNPDIVASEYNVEAAEELRRQAKAALYPTVEFFL
jgi:outer membrane protein TolC